MVTVLFPHFDHAAIAKARARLPTREALLDRGVVEMREEDGNHAFSECRMQNAEGRIQEILGSAFCILHSALRINPYLHITADRVYNPLTDRALTPGDAAFAQLRAFLEGRAQ